MMKKRKIIRRKLFHSFIFLLILCALLFKINQIFTFKDRSQHIDAKLVQLNGFDKNEIDALFIGGSRSLRAINPIVIYQETGLKGFNLSTITQPPIMTKHLAIKYIERFDPDYIFLDPSGIENNASLESSKPYRYPAAFDLLNDKLAVNSILNEMKILYPNDDQMPYRFPLYRDHVRWRSLRMTDFISLNDYDDFFLGFTNKLSLPDDLIDVSVKIPYSNYSKSPSWDEVSYNEYQELANYLRETDIEVFILVLPELQSGGRAGSSKIFAEQNNFNFIDASIIHEFEKIGFSSVGDFYDSGHLSFTGAHKYSEYLGNILKSEYAISVDLAHPLYDQYVLDYMQFYTEFKENYEVHYD